MSKIVFIPSYVETGVGMLNKAKQILAEIPAEVQAGIAIIQGTNYNGGIPTFDTGASASAKVSSLEGKIDYIIQQIERYSSGNYIFSPNDIVIMNTNDTEMIQKFGISEKNIMPIDEYEKNNGISQSEKDLIKEIIDNSNVTMSIPSNEQTGTSVRDAITSGGITGGIADYMKDFMSANERIATSVQGAEPLVDGLTGAPVRGALTGIGEQLTENILPRRAEGSLTGIGEQLTENILPRRTTGSLTGIGEQLTENILPRRTTGALTGMGEQLNENITSSKTISGITGGITDYLKENVSRNAKINKFEMQD